MASDSDIQALGGDYQNLQAWFDAKDSVAGTHTAHVANEYIDGRLLLNNGSTVATAFIVQPQSGARHNGTSRNVASAGAALRHTDRVIWLFSANGASLTIRDMVLEQTASANPVIDVTSTGSSVTTFERLVVEKRGTATAISFNIAHDTTIHDCIGYGHTNFGIDTRLAGTNSIEGNTVIGGIGSATHGILPKDAGSVFNNISVGHSTADFFGTGSTASFGNNIAEDATAHTAWGSSGNSFNSVEVHETGGNPTADYVAFVDKDTAGSEDFHLVDLEDVDGDNVALANGATGKGSGTDIDGDARDGSTPDIGADEVAAPVGGDELPVGTLNLLGVGV